MSFHLRLLAFFPFGRRILIRPMRALRVMYRIPWTDSIRTGLESQFFRFPVYSEVRMVFLKKTTITRRYPIPTVMLILASILYVL